MTPVTKKQQFLSNVKLGDILLFDKRKVYLQVSKNIDDPLVEFWLPNSNQFLLKPDKMESTALVCDIRTTPKLSFFCLVTIPDEISLLGWVDGSMFATREMNRSSV